MHRFRGRPGGNAYDVQNVVILEKEKHYFLYSYLKQKDGKPQGLRKGGPVITW